LKFLSNVYPAEPRDCKPLGTPNVAEGYPLLKTMEPPPPNY